MYQVAFDTLEKYELFLTKVMYQIAFDTEEV